jgi:hypothetical protein
MKRAQKILSKTVLNQFDLSVVVLTSSSDKGPKRNSVKIHTATNKSEWKSNAFRIIDKFKL